MAQEQARDHAGVVAQPPLIFLSAFLAGWLLQRRRPMPLRTGLRTRIVAGPLLLGGAGLILWALIAFRRAGTPVEPHRPVRSLVTSGPYRFSRNPIYTAITMLYLGATSLMDSLWPLLFLPMALMVMRRGVIEREERYLQRLFGEAYRTYARQVRRWL